MLPQLIGGASAIPQFGGGNGGGNGTFPAGGGFPNGEAPNGAGFPGAPQATAEVTAEATVEATPETATPTAVALALTAQTGLSTDDLLAQIQAGSTVADLVAANNGDLNAVITTIAGALDDLTTSGGFGAQMVTRLGSDTTQIATQLVNGELGQAQQFLLPQLISGESAAPQFGGGNGTFPAGAPGGGAFPGGAPAATAEANVVIPAANTPLAPATLAAPPDVPTSEPTQPAANSDETAVAQALTAQTGLSTDELLAQIQAGSTIADLVAAHNGDLNAAITAIASALDDMVTAGGREAQMIERFGSDTTQVATQLVNGDLGQAQNFLLPQLISGESALPQLNGQAPNGGPIEDTPAPSPTPTIPRTPTPTVPRPTRIVFPTATPTSEASATPAAEATGAVSSSAVLGAQTCGIIVDYNLNLRDQPSTEGSTVLISIPFGSTVSADAHNSDNWYHVAYEGQIGWVSGDYVTASAACADLPSAP